MFSFKRTFQDSVYFPCFPGFCVFIFRDLVHQPRFVQIYPEIRHIPKLFQPLFEYNQLLL